MTLALLALGCQRASVRDGRVPAEVLPQARALSGLYLGKFAGREGKLRLALVGDRPVVLWQDAQDRRPGGDLLDPRCGSRVGRLKELRTRVTENGTEKIRSAVFAFDPGACSSVQGRTLEISFNGENRFNIYLLDREETDSARPAEHYFSGTFRRR